MKFKLIFLLLFLSPLILSQRPRCLVLLPEINTSYEGRCRNGLAHGLGIATGLDEYNGFFRRGLPHGEGQYVYANGDIYEGGWKDGLKHGKATFFIAEADSSYTGIWKNGEFVRSVYAHETREVKYQIRLRRNYDRARFYRMGDGVKVIFKFTDSTGRGRSVSNLLIDGSSGSYYNLGREVGYDNIHFPFDGKVRFTSLSKMQTGLVEYELQFTIFEPGFWEVTIHY